MTPDQDILNDMAQTLGRIAPDEAQEMFFRGKIYDDFAYGNPGWVDDTGEEVLFGSDRPLPIAAIKEVLALAEKLQDTPVFKASPFTHFEVRLNRVPEVKVNFADIPVEQDWDYLFMRPISDLSLEEAQELEIPENKWRNCIESS